MGRGLASLRRNNGGDTLSYLVFRLWTSPPSHFIIVQRRAAASGNLPRVELYSWPCRRGESNLRGIDSLFDCFLGIFFFALICRISPPQFAYIMNHFSAGRYTLVSSTICISLLERVHEAQMSCLSPFSHPTCCACACS